MTPQEAFRITMSIGAFEFETFGEAAVSVDGFDTPVEALVRWTQDGGIARFHDPTLHLHGLTLGNAPNRIASKEKRISLKGRAAESEWFLENGFVSSHRMRANQMGTRDDFKVEFDRISLERSDSPCSYQLVIAQGFNAAIFGPDEDKEIRGFDFTWSEGEGALLVLPTKDQFGDPFVAACFQHQPLLTNAQIESLLWLLSLLGGRVVNLSCVAKLDTNMTETGRQLYRHQRYPRRTWPPFRLSYPIDGIRYLQRDFGVMLDALCRSQQAPTIEIGVAISHLLADSAYIDTEIRDITLALDTLIESDAFKPVTTQFIEREEFDAASIPLRNLLRKHLSTGAVKRANGIIDSINEATHALRRKRFWDRIDFAPSRPEKAALKHRHTMSHRGFLVSAQGGDKEWQRLSYDVAILRTLVNRCLLSLLGWRNPAMNYMTYMDEPMPSSVKPNP